MPSISSSSMSSKIPERRWRALGWLDGLIAGLAGDTRRTFLWLGTWAVFLALIQVETLGLSLAGAIITQPVAMLILLGAAAGAWIFFDFGNHRLRLRMTGTSLNTSSKIERVAGRVVVAAGAIFTTFVVCFALSHPDLSWDAMTYHIPPIHYWTLKGRVGWIEGFPPYTREWLAGNVAMSGRTDVCMNGYPKAAELVSYVLVNALRHDQVMNLGNLLFYPLAVLGIAGLARLFGASAWIAAACGMLFPFIPVVVAQSVTNYNDIGMAATAIGLLAAMAQSCVAACRGRLRAAEVVGFACLAGLALGIKYNGLPLVAMALTALILFMLAGLLMGEGRTQGRPARAFLLLGHLLVILIGILLIAGYWYGRNAKMTGNPIFPVQVTLFGRVVFEGIPYRNLLLSGSADFRAMVNRVWISWLQGRDQWPGSILGYDSTIGGIGFLWLYGCVPAIILYAAYSIVRLVGRRGGPLSARVARFAAFWPVAVIVLALFDITSPGNHIARYVVWIYGLGLPCLAAVASWLMGRRRALALRLAAGALFLGGAFWHVHEGAILYGYNRARYETMMGYQKRDNGIPKSDWTPLDIAVCADGGLRFHGLIKEVMTSNKPVAYGAFPRRIQGMFIAGILSHPIGERPIYYLDEAVMNDPKQFEEFVMRNGVKYIILDGKHIEKPPAHIDAIDDKNENNGAYLIIKMP